jgi:L-iditol 2-dehydrogenase
VNVRSRSTDPTEESKVISGIEEGRVQCARLVGPGDLVLTDEAMPEPTPERPLLRVMAVGLCGSDAHWYEDGSIGDAIIERPLILGHEFSGEVLTGPWAGRRVAVDPAVPCLACEACRSDQAHLCRRMEFAGHGRTDGALRTHLTWPQRCLVPLPDEMTDAAGAMLEPLGVALHAIDLATDREQRPAQSWNSAGVFGSGPIGLLLIAALKSIGVSNIIATDRLAHRLSAALAMGADSTAIATNARGEMKDVLQATNGRGVDVAFDASGDPFATESAVAGTRPGGLVVLVGIPSNDRTTFTASAARRRETSMVTCRRMRAGDLERAANLAATGAIPLDRMISERFSLESVDGAFRALTARRGLKLIVEP